jgi:hypothetical protein
VEEAARSFILLLTFLAIIYWAAHQPKPVEVVETKYCPIGFRAAYKDENGEWVKVWAKGYGPCELMDRYEEA